MRNRIAVRKQLNSYLLTTRLEDYSWKPWCWTKVLKNRDIILHISETHQCYLALDLSLVLSLVIFVWFPYPVFWSVGEFFLACYRLGFPLADLSGTILELKGTCVDRETTVDRAITYIHKYLICIHLDEDYTCFPKPALFSC